jgi:hypothetical protein
LETAFWLNAWSDVTYRLMHGDKDSFALGFAAAGKADEYEQLALPPGGAFRCAFARHRAAAMRCQRTRRRRGHRSKTEESHLRA